MSGFCLSCVRYICRDRETEKILAEIIAFGERKRGSMYIDGWHLHAIKKEKKGRNSEEKIV